MLAPVGELSLSTGVRLSIPYWSQFLNWYCIAVLGKKAQYDAKTCDHPCMFDVPSKFLIIFRTRAMFDVTPPSVLLSNGFADEAGGESFEGAGVFGARFVDKVKNPGTPQETATSRLVAQGFNDRTNDLLTYA